MKFDASIVAKELIYVCQQTSPDCRRVLDLLEILSTIEDSPIESKLCDEQPDYAFRVEVRLAIGVSVFFEYDVVTLFDGVEQREVLSEISPNQCNAIVRCLRFWLGEHLGSQTTAVADATRRLIARFENCAEKHPLMRLVFALRPKSFDNVPHEIDECEGILHGVHPAISGRFKSQSYWIDHEPITYDSEQEIHSVSLPDFSLPYWHFETNSKPWEHGLWALWLHRDRGSCTFDSQKFLSMKEQLDCLELHASLFHDAGTWAPKLFRDSWPNWISCHVDNSCDHEQPNVTTLALRWLIFAATRMPSRTESCWGRRNRGETEPINLRIVEEVTEKSAFLLREGLRNFEASFQETTRISSTPDHAQKSSAVAGTHKSLDRTSKGPRELRTERDDALLAKFGTDEDEHPTYQDLADWLVEVAPKSGWTTIEANGIRDCLLRAWQRQHPEEIWPFDRRGKRKRLNKETRKQGK